MRILAFAVLALTLAGCGQTPAPAPAPAASLVVDSPADTVERFRAAMKAGDAETYRAMMHIRPGGAWVGQVHDRLDRMSKGFRSGKYDIRVLDSETRGRCGVVIIWEQRAGSQLAFDPDPLHLLREPDGWKLLARMHAWDDPMHNLDAQDKSDFAALTTWYESRKLDLKTEFLAGQIEGDAAP